MRIRVVDPDLEWCGREGKLMRPLAFGIERVWVRLDAERGGPHKDRRPAFLELGIDQIEQADAPTSVIEQRERQAAKSARSRLRSRLRSQERNAQWNERG